MSYIGVQPTAGQYRKLDDISASFNGSTTSFTTSVGGTNVTAGTAQQLLVSVGGVIQEPDADYTVSTNTITFTTAPASGLDFFAILMGDALNTVSTSDGSITTAKLAGSLSVGLAAGTNSAPSLYFTGDSNTGVYSPGADQVAVTTGGTARLTIDSSGNVNIDSNTLYVDAANNRVGLGTSSPSYLLDCKSTGATNVARFLTGATTSSEVAQFGRSDQAVNLSIDYDGAGSMGIGTTTAHPFNLKTGAVTRATIDTSGRLGIGTTAATARLQVKQSAARQGLWCEHPSNDTTIRVGIDSDASTAAIAASFASTGSYYPLTFSTSDTERARIDTSGRLLVGTSSARSNFFNTTLSANLQVEGTDHDTSSMTFIRNSANTGSPTLSLCKTRGTSNGSNTAAQNGDDLGFIAFQGADGTDFVAGAYIYAQVDGTPGANDMPGRLVFSTTADGASSPTERMRISADGSVLVGATSPYTTGVTLRRDATSQFTTTITGTTSAFVVSTGTYDPAFVVRGNGGIANYSGNNVNLSDRNYKKDIVPAPGTWDCLKEWEIVNFRYKDQPDNADLNMGVIAQQVAESCPEVITVFQEAKEATETEPAQEERLGVKDQQMMWMAIKALQEAQVRIETLEAEVAALKGA